MPSIYDNLADGSRLGPALQEALDAFDTVDVATGYLDLRGWSNVSDIIASKIADDEPPKAPVARVLIGMVMVSDPNPRVAGRHAPADDDRCLPDLG